MSFLSFFLTYMRCVGYPAARFSHFTRSDFDAPMAALVSCRSASMPASTFTIRASTLVMSGLGLLPKGLDISLGRQVAVEQGDMFVGQRFGLLIGETAVRQALDEAVGIERDGL